MQLLTGVQDLQAKSGMMLDKLEKEWSEFNIKLPPTIEEARHTVDSLQVHCNYCHTVILFHLLSCSCFIGSLHVTNK